MFSHYQEICRFSAIGDAESVAKVAVIDSIFDIWDNPGYDLTISRNRDLLTGVEERDTTNHGSIVTNIILSYAHNVDFHFYRGIQANGNVLTRDLIKAIGYAHLEDEVDIINLSLGNDHNSDGNHSCGSDESPCKLRKICREAIDDGIIIIGAHGNKDQVDSNVCPARDDDVLSVGGFVSECKARLDPDDPITLGRGQLKPPSACWIERDDGDTEGGVYCTGSGCSVGFSCDDYQRISEWEGNVEEEGKDPDILAPVIYPIERDDGPSLISGTSFAAPAVTALAAEMVAGLSDHGVTYTPNQICKAIRQGSDKRQGYRLLHGDSAHRTICDWKGLEFEPATSGPEHRVWPL